MVSLALLCLRHAHTLVSSVLDCVLNRLRLHHEHSSCMSSFKFAVLIEVMVY